MIRFGVMGLGNIAHRVIQGILSVDDACLYAVCSRSIDKANQYKKQYHACVSYGSYEDMLQDKNVDVVYICTPNHLHLEQILLCFSYGKHVICEKPMVRSNEELARLEQASKKNRCFLMEAHKTCFIPVNVEIRKRLQSGQYGKILSIQADYSYDCKDQYEKDSWAMNPLYGGSSYDVGVYPICFCHYMANSEMKHIVASPIRYQDYQCDFGMMSQIQYENGIVAQANCSWLYYSENKGKAIIVTEQGTITIPSFWKSEVAYIDMNGKKEQLTIKMKSDFAGEIQEACDCLNEKRMSKVMNFKMSHDILDVVECVNEYRLNL